MKLVYIRDEKIELDRLGIKMFSDDILILINNELVYEGSLRDYEAIGINNYHDPLVIEVFVKLDRVALFVEKVVARNLRMSSDRLSIKHFVNNFYNELARVVYD